MAKIACKGTKFQQTISAALVDVAQLISMNLSGAQSKTYEGTSLDTDVWEEYPVTGYSDGGSFGAELFYDPALAGHQALTDRLGVPAVGAYKVIYSDSANTQQPFNAGGITFGVTVAMGDGLKASIDLKITGDPGFPTS